VLGEEVLITGAGPIGCMAAAIARHAGARHVVVTDVNPYRLRLAQKMGATLALDISREKIEDAQKKLGMKEGFDVGMEMSGKVILNWHGLGLFLNQRFSQRNPAIAPGP
jgi:threonine 3-dehydrogenase